MKARERDLSRQPPRAIRDEELKPGIWRVWEENYRLYGARKIWSQMGREGFKVARCTMARLVREMAIRGVTRGKKVKTTWPATADIVPLDRVNRDFVVSAPNRLWVADLTFVATWLGFVYVAFVIDAFACCWTTRRIRPPHRRQAGLEFPAHRHRPG